MMLHWRALTASRYSNLDKLLSILIPVSSTAKPSDAELQISNDSAGVEWLQLVSLLDNLK